MNTMMQTESRFKAMYTISWPTALGCLKLTSLCDANVSCGSRIKNTDVQVV